MNIFLFNKSLRYVDNIALIYQTIECSKTNSSIIPIFIFTEQINKKKNLYYSENSVKFMCESLKELADDIKKKYNGKLYFFHSDNFIDVFKEIIKINKIDSIGCTFDYSPYAVRRQTILEDFCTQHNITFYIQEDCVLYNIKNPNTLKSDGTPYMVYTPFKNHCKKLHIDKPNKFKEFKFIKNNALHKNKYYINESEINKFYNSDLDKDKQKDNEDEKIYGGRLSGLKILKNAHKFNDYKKNRDYLIYNTTRLAAYINFGVISIREIHEAFKLNKDLINQLIWNNFYCYLSYHFPHTLEGQIGKKNKTFKPKFDKVKWHYNEILFNKWTTGNLGIPICDAGMRQLSTTGYLHNRGRMIVSSVLTKLLLIDWKLGEKWFANNLIDYNSIQNNFGWNWTCGGVDPQNVFRIFNPYIQSRKYDPNTEYIKRYIPELKNVPVNDIHNWNLTYSKYIDKIDYVKPQIDYKIARSKGIKAYKIL